MSLELTMPGQNKSGPAEMMKQAEKFALAKTSKTSAKTFSLAVTAGVFIGLAFMFYITVTTGSGGIGWGLNRLIGGVAFSLGLILVVLCGGELFTSTVLSVIARANKQITSRKMFATWGKVYIGNFVGATLLLGLVAMAGLYNLDHGQWGASALNLAQHKLHHTPLQAFSLGVLCNLLVCLAIWLTFSSQQVLTKASLMVLPVAMFVSTGFEHCVANMFMVPLGIFIQQTASPEFWHMIGASPAQYADLTWVNFFSHNLLPVTLGNIVGGALLVGLTYWGIFSDTQKSASDTDNTTNQIKPNYISDKDYTMNFDALKIENHMNKSPFTLSAATSIGKALDQLHAEQLDGAPVLDQDQQLVGFFSEHDVLIELWCNDYMPEAGLTVGDLMSRDLQTVAPSDSLMELAEYLCIDKRSLYPVSDMGIATSLSQSSLTMRARTQKVARPKVFPVVEQDQLVGVISRQVVMKALRPAFGEATNVLNSDIRKTA